MGERIHFLVAATLVAACFGIYGQTYHHDFLSLDDGIYVTANHTVRSGLTLRGLDWAWTEFSVQNYHPITWLSHMLDVELFGIEPGAHHLMSVAFHALNSVLLYALLFALTGATGRSALVAGLFAVHPAHMESVAWIAERKDVLSTALALGCLLAWTRWVRRGGAAARAASIGLFALALLSKPMVVTLPFAMLLLDFWPLGRLASTSELPRRLGEKWPFFILSAGGIALTLLAQESSVIELPLDVRLINSVVSYARYVAHAVWPVDLAVLYPYPDFWPLSTVAGSATLLVALTAAALAWVRRAPYLLVGWLWFAGMLVPVIGWIQVGVQSMADRYLYLPIAGLFIAVAWGATDLLGSGRATAQAKRAIAVAALLGFAASAFHQLPRWRGNEPLFRHAIAVTDQNFAAHWSLGHGLLHTGETEIAIEEFRRTLALAPWFAPGHVSLGKALIRTGDLKSARLHLEKASSVSPRALDLYFALGQIEEGERDFTSAVARYTEQLRHDPRHVPALFRLALLQASKRQEVRDPESAVRHATLACEITAWSTPRELNALSIALAAGNRLEEAVETAERALAVARELDAGHAVTSAIETRIHNYRERLDAGGA